MGAIGCLLQSYVESPSGFAPLGTPERQSLCEPHRQRRWLTYWSYAPLRRTSSCPTVAILPALHCSSNRAPCACCDNTSPRGHPIPHVTACQKTLLLSYEVQRIVVYSNVWCEELSQTKMSDNIFAASREGWALERWEGQQRAECRKTCGRGAKQTKIMGMGYSTRRRDLWQGYSSCRE